MKLIKSLYSKEAILYTINLYLEEYNYELDENETQIIITVKWDFEERLFDLFKKELTFNTLRFEIANNNRELRKVIISKALGSVNVD